MSLHGIKNEFEIRADLVVASMLLVCVGENSSCDVEAECEERVQLFEFSSRFASKKSAFTLAELM